MKNLFPEVTIGKSCGAPGLHENYDEDNPCPLCGFYPTEPKTTLRKEIEIVINKHSAENESNTPDFILASYLETCLAAFDTAVNARTKWYGKNKDA